MGSVHGDRVEVESPGEGRTSVAGEHDRVAVRNPGSYLVSGWVSEGTVTRVATRAGAQSRGKESNDRGGRNCRQTTAPTRGAEPVQLKMSHGFSWIGWSATDRSVATRTNPSLTQT